MISDTPTLDLVLIPHVGVGPFRFGKSLSSCGASGMDFVQVDEYISPDGKMVTYEFPSIRVRVTTEDGLISIVGCYRQVRWGTVELIGLSTEELVASLGEPDEWGERELLSDGYQQPIEYEALGLQVWLKGNRTVVALFSCDNE